MALALDTDFRTALSSAVPENALRRTPEGGLGGEEFAKNLQRVRESELTTAEAAGAQASLLAAPASLPPVAEDGAALLPVTGSGSLPIIEANVELGLDAERAATAPVPTPPPSPLIEKAALPAAVLVEPSVPAPEAVPVTSAVSAIQEPVAAADPVASAPAATKPSEASDAIVPVTTEQPALAAVATVITNPSAAKTADQPGRAPAITQTGPAAARPLAKSDAEGSAPISADAQAALDAAAPDLVNAASSTPSEAALAAALTSDTGQSSAALGNSLGVAAAPSAVTPGVTASAPAVPMTPAHALLIASPAGVVDIVSQAAEDGKSDRIVVQLDPPELGRVSIDFKFDAQGLQHVTITSETPEAMRQLRMMHADLVQALERQGIAGQNMTFEHQQQSAQQTPLPNPFARSAAIAASSDDEATTAIAAADLRQTARTLPGGRLDMRV